MEVRSGRESSPDCEVEQIVSVPDLVPYEEFCAGRFTANGHSHKAGSMRQMRCSKRRAAARISSVIRSEAGGMVDDEMRRRMGLIVPHVRRAGAPARSLIEAGRSCNLRPISSMGSAPKSSLSMLKEDHTCECREPQCIGEGRSHAPSMDGLQLPMRRLIGRCMMPSLSPAVATPRPAAKERSAAAERYRQQSLCRSRTCPKVRGRYKAGMGSEVVAALFVRKAEFETVPPSEVIGKTYN